MPSTHPNRTGLLIRRGLAGLFCIIIVPVLFQKMDEEYVVPQRLKRLVEVLVVEPLSDREWLRARVQLHHRGSQPSEVALALVWLDDRGREVAQSRSNVQLSPDDTVTVRLAVKRPAGKQAVQHRLEYTATPVP